MSGVNTFGQPVISEKAVLETGLKRPPRFYPLPNPEAKHRLDFIGPIAASMGRPLLPWQAFVNRCASELAPAGSRLLFRYQEIWILVPRQAGKTTVFRAYAVDRALSMKAQIFMTAQLGKDAGARWADLVNDLKESPISKALANPVRSNGQQVQKFPTGAEIRPFAPSKESLHGYSPDLINWDEYWAFTREAAAELDVAIEPAMITRRARQVWRMSAAGDLDSTALADLIQMGRTVANRPDSNIAYFEWSAPEDADFSDPATYEFHPGLDGLITVEDLTKAYKRAEDSPEDSESSISNFVRSYMNVQPSASTSIFDVSALEELKREGLRPPERPVFFFDVALDRTMSTIYAAWIHEDGTPELMLYKRARGAYWLLEELKLIHERGAVIAADNGGKTRPVIQEAQNAGIPVRPLTGSELSTSWQAFKDKLEDAKGSEGETRETFRHCGARALSESLTLIRERASGDSVAPSRSRSLGDVSPAIAAAGALFVAGQQVTNLQMG